MKSIPPRQEAYLLDIFRSVEVIQQYITGWISISSETIEVHLPLLFHELKVFLAERGGR